jgi:hypothetical protein
MDKAKSKILVLVEGAKTDYKLMDKLLSVYGIDSSHQIVPYNTNIYTLYNAMFRDKDPDSLDLLQVLREREPDQEKKKLFDEAYSDILLIFDLDPQAPDFTPDKICEMALHFTESTDMGKLYLNYPMVEAFYHMKDIPDPDYITYVATMDELQKGQYKKRVNAENRNHDQRKFATNKEECNTIIRQNMEKACLIVARAAPNELVEVSVPDGVQILQEQLKQLSTENVVAVLCTCVFYIVDYNPGLIVIGE